MLISVEETGKNQLDPGQESMEFAAVLSQCSLPEVLDQNRPLCWSIVVRENPTVGAPFFGTFSCDRIPKPTKDVIVYLYIQFYSLCHTARPVNYNNEFRERF